MVKRKILVAEDDTVLRDLYLRKFDTNIYDVHTAANGQEVIDFIAKEKPELLLLDINMPVLDGFQVLEKLPQRAERGFPVIILTNFADEANRERGMKLGVDDYFIKKDMTVKSLIEMVQKFLGVKAA